MTATVALPLAGLPPSALSRFVGRSRELAAVAELSGSTRLLTLTGAGGSGKTRLAAETVTRVAHRWDAVAWVDLAPATDSAQVANKVGAAFGPTEREESAAIAGLEQALRDRPALLVLDNCEHVINSVAGLADRLLRGAARPSILATVEKPSASRVRPPGWSPRWFPMKPKSFSSSGPDRSTPRLR